LARRCTACSNGPCGHRSACCPPQTARLTPRRLSAQAQELQRLADQVLGSPACAPFFYGTALRWAANEMPISHREPGAGATRVLRIDRVVRLEEQGSTTWWVLDYKLRQQPGELAAYREQLERYRQALQGLVREDRVRAAFITAGGALVEL
jgi:ATP-dependent helicase/nuclease subunit A